MNNQQNELRGNIGSLFESIYAMGWRDASRCDPHLETDCDDAIFDTITLITQQLTAQLDRLEKWVEYNKHDMGEMGEFIRTKYVHNALTQEREQL